jgi:hypothetical protein
MKSTSKPCLPAIISILMLLSLPAACRQSNQNAAVGSPAAAEGAEERPGIDQTVIASSTDAIVDTESGRVRGYIRSGTFTFKGIPYATAERFMPSEKPAPWNG